MAIPETLPVNVFGSSVVTENAVLSITIATSQVGSSRLSVDGASYLRVANTGASGLVKLELPDPALCAGQTRTLLNAGGAAQNIQFVAYDATGAGGGAGVGPACVPFAANSGGVLATIAGCTVACDGSSWFLVAQTLLPNNA